MRLARIELCGVEWNGADWLPGCPSCSDSTPEHPPGRVSFGQCPRCGAGLVWQAVTTDGIDTAPHWDRMIFGARV